MLRKIFQLIKGIKNKPAEPSLQVDLPISSTTTSTAPICSEITQSGKIHISPMPSDLRERVMEWGLTRPTLCYHNSFQAVIKEGVNGRQDFSYVLGWVTHEYDGIKAQHAWLKCGDKYYDPTLEPQNLLLGATHESKYEFSFQVLKEMLFDRFGEEHVKKMMKGEEAWWPLMLAQDGYEFADV